jgi:hypothetical protein
MTPKEKALQLVHRYVDLTDGWVYGTKNWEHKKQCALIAVDEVVAQIEPSVSMDVISARIEYWQQVKQEIEKL